MAANSDLERLARELDWNLLRTFVTLAEAGSVTAAADRLRLKQPTVSSALKRLEARLGRKLIDRSPGHFHLTDAGNLLYREAIDIQGAILRLGTLMRDVAEEVRGHVRIAVASHVLSPVFNDALSAFHTAHPAATISIDVAASKFAIAEEQRAQRYVADTRAGLGQEFSAAVCVGGHRTVTKSLWLNSTFTRRMRACCGSTLLRLRNCAHAARSLAVGSRQRIRTNASPMNRPASFASRFSSATDWSCVNWLLANANA